MKTDEYFKCFDFYEDLDNLTINIKSDLLIKKHNADKVKGNTYSWNITKDNYENKSILLEIKTSNSNKKLNKKNIIIITLLVLFITLAIIILKKLIKK